MEIKKYLFVIPACSYQDMGDRDGRSKRSPAYAVVSTMRNLSQIRWKVRMDSWGAHMQTYIYTLTSY